MSCLCTNTSFNCRQGRDCPLRAQGTPTVRRHPRTLAEAFPDVRAVAIEPHRPLPLKQRIAMFFRRFA